MRSALPAELGLCLVLAAPRASAQGINSGSETGNFSGWPQFGDVTLDSVRSSGTDSRYQSEGNYGGSFGCVTGLGSGITQAVPTMLATYQLSFDYRRIWNRPNLGPNFFRVSWGGLEVFADTATYGATSPWFTETFLVSGTGSPVELRFTTNNAGDFYALDNIRLDPAAVPEPALVQLPFLLGLAGIGAWRRRRRS